MLISHSSHRQVLADVLPSSIQPFITWLSGIPIQEEADGSPMAWWIVILLGVFSIFLGFLFISIALASPILLAIVLYITGFCFVAGGMRRLDVLIIHQTLHNKVLSTPRANRILGEFLTTVLLRTPFEENRKEHMDHHKAPCDEEDVDVCFLRRTGVAMACKPSALYLRVLLVTFSPMFHLRFTIGRLHSNFIKAQPLYRVAMAWVYLALLILPTLMFGIPYLIGLALFWLIPLTIGFQMSNFLYTATKHRWWLFENRTVKDKQKRDLLSYARICCSPAPQKASFLTWALWWAEALFVHVPTRLFIVVGDTVQHDLHHVAPGCDWPNSAQERLKYKAKAPERFTEVWGGYFAHLKECNLKGKSHDIKSQYPAEG